MSDGSRRSNDEQGRCLVAAARIAAHFVDAAVRAGLDRAEIEATLRGIVDGSVLSEIWISDETGAIAYSSVEGRGDGFAFPTDPSGDGQAAPFAALLTGDRNVVVQEPRPRELDGAVFRYVAVAGVDRPRVVQVGVAV